MIARGAAACLVLSLVAGCSGKQSGSPGSPGAGDAISDEDYVPPKGPMTREEAQRYVLYLVNRDRKAQDLPPVRWDDTAAKAGQRQADDMASHGFTAHIGSDGSVPELRYTEAGGDHMVMENVGCFADGQGRELDPDARFTAEGLAEIERKFMDEVPPFDGHRRNILTPWHTSFGVGLSQTKGLGIPCMAQEFTDAYGEYDELPAKAHVGAKIKVKGTMKAPAQVAGVGVARVDKPKPQKPSALNQTHSYAIPKPATTYFPKGYKTPIPLEVNGEAFSIEVPLSVESKPGMYTVSVWAKLPQTKDLVMVSLRTIAVN